ncbi:MAG: HAD family phosphatase [Deltaproteobacteria bacterium]|nr:HAD family phosphatase [Deltaproteobacteria bacterium]MBW2389646.1 HAD family phosphatase [Deltaproteobacteria bacterium]MBW2725168.1 HAD family phosphatase [Deltaproteobacteria bacterium]
MSIEAVLFDLGGVYTDSPFTAMDEVSAELGTTPDTIREILFGDYHVDNDHPWHRLERGEVTLQIAREEIIALGRERDLEIDPLVMLSRIGTGGGTRDVLIHRTRELRNQGYKTALLTNNFAEVRLAWRKLLPVDELFDVVVDSSEVGMRKPNPAIFQHTLELLSVSAEQSIFLDDFAGNIAAAARLGIRGVLVGSDINAAIHELNALLAAR